MNASSDNSEESFFASRGFGLDLGFGERPALLVIDIMNAFSDPSQPLGANMDPQIDAFNTLLDMAHAAPRVSSAPISSRV
jgi:maleamate amidohydrolase